MKNTILRTFFCLTFLFSLVYGQSTFVRALDLYDNGPQTALHPASGGYIRLDKNLNTVISRLDSLGQPVMSVAVNLPGQPYHNGIGLERMTNGRYVAASGNDITSRLMILDSMGTPIVCKSLPERRTVSGIAAAPGGGFYAVGQGLEYIGTNQIYSGWAAKLDAQGDTVWTRTYHLPQSNNITFKDVVVLPNGDLIILGNLVNQIVTLLHVSASGQLVWLKYYRGPSGLEMVGDRLVCNQAGQLLVGGSFNSGSTMAGVASIDTLGNLQWSRILQGVVQPIIRKAGLTASGDLVLVGRSIDLSQAFQDTPFNICISKTGNVVWSHAHRTGGGSMSDIDLLPDGGLVMTAALGYCTVTFKTTPTDSLQSGCQPADFNANPSIDPLDSTTTINVVEGHLAPLTNLTFTTTPVTPQSYDHCLTLSIGKDLPGLRVQVLPQPLLSSARILLSAGSLADDAQLHITDLSGRSLALPLTRLRDGWEIQRGGLPAGIYAYQVLQEGQRIASGKLWIAD